VVQTSFPPKTFNIRRDLRPSWTGIRPFSGQIRESGVLHGCSGIKDQRAGRTHEQQCGANLSMFLGRKEKAMNSWKIADPP
jgi:hypothetical protein